MKQVERFTSEMSFDKESGWDIVFLEHVVEYPKHCKSVGIVPKAGSIIYSFKLGDHEVLLQPPELRDLRSRKYGAPVLYPTPGRVRNGQFTFDHKTYKYTPNMNSHFIHGFVYGVQWYFNKPKSSEAGAEFKTFIDVEPGEALYMLWPFRHRISQTYLLNREGLTISFAVENFDKKPIPFGFALHPFFNIMGSKTNTWLEVPAQKQMILQDLMPTGRLQDMDQAQPDIRRPSKLSDLYLDDVYWGLGPDRTSWWEARDAGLRFTMEASEEFNYMVVYTQPQDCFCMENQTCSPDAHNLYAEGYKQESGLLVVEPGEKRKMWIRYNISYI